MHISRRRIFRESQSLRLFLTNSHLDFLRIPIEFNYNDENLARVAIGHLYFWQGTKMVPCLPPMKPIPDSLEISLSDERNLVLECGQHV